MNGTPIIKTQVAYGTLISTLDLAGDKTTKPANHVALWAGDYPCDSTGSKLVNLVNEQNKNEKIRERREAPEGGKAQEELVATFSFSQRPGPEGYPDYYQKMTTYIKILEGHAYALDPNATSRTHPVIIPDDEEALFCYLNNAPSRAGISAVDDKLKKGKMPL